MTGWVRYALLGAVLLGAGVGALWPFLEPPGRRGVLLAAGVAYPVQLVSLALRRRFRSSAAGFLGTLAGGALLRMGVVLGVGVWVALAGSPAPAETLLGLVGFLVLLLFLEPLFLQDGGGAPARRSGGGGGTGPDGGTQTDCGTG